jgi:hypothetical protein
VHSLNSRSPRFICQGSLSKPEVLAQKLCHSNQVNSINKLFREQEENFRGPPFLLICQAPKSKINMITESNFLSLKDVAGMEE